MKSIILPFAVSASIILSACTASTSIQSDDADLAIKINDMNHPGFSGGFLA